MNLLSRMRLPAKATLQRGHMDSVYGHKAEIILKTSKVDVIALADKDWAMVKEEHGQPFVCRLNELTFEPSPEGLPEQKRPTVVCLCGSSKYPEHHMKAMMEETLAGKIVIPMGLYGHADFPPGARKATGDADDTGQVKQMLDKLHFARIDLADEILVVNVNGYVGNSTAREIEYAKNKGIKVRYLFEPSGPSPWKPIETAPKGSKDVLLRYIKNTRTSVSGFPVVTEAWCDGDAWYDALDRLIVVIGAKNANNIPTHWMPLPPVDDDFNQERDSK
jgi:hypothetical protein